MLFASIFIRFYRIARKTTNFIGFLKNCPKTDKKGVFTLKFVILEKGDFLHFGKKGVFHVVVNYPKLDQIRVQYVLLRNSRKKQYFLWYFMFSSIKMTYIYIMN